MIELYITPEGIIKTTYSSNGIVLSKAEFPNEDHLPEPVKSQLAALKLMQNNQDVETIGQKVSDKLFWIYEKFPDSNENAFQYIMFALYWKRPLYEYLDKHCKGDDYEIVRERNTGKTVSDGR